METLKEIRKNYVKIYGQTSPCYEADMVIGRQKFVDVENYLGCTLKGDRILFSFSPKACEHWHEIEMHFRNRLSRKISFSMGSCVTEVFVSGWPEELGEFLTAAMDLDNYFRGNPPAPRLVAEYRLYIQEQDWRNPELVKEEMAKL